MRRKKKSRIGAKSRNLRRKAGKSRASRPGRFRKPVALEIAVAIRPALFRELLCHRLERDNGMTIVGQAATEEEIGVLLSSSRPAVLIFDYEGLGPNAEGSLIRLRHVAPATRILVLASRSGEETVQRVLRAGASGLIGKHLGYEMLARAIHAIAAGEIWANRHATSEVLERLTTFSGRVDKVELTHREKQIAECCTLGLRNKEIASRLNISSKTVKSHLNNIFRKLRVDNRVELVLGLAGAPAQPQPRS